MGLIEKTLHFDEEQLRARSMVNRDYGYMNILEAKTPFPRRGEAVAARTLRQRLLDLLEEHPSHRNSSDVSSEMDNVSLQSKEFVRKRHDFTLHEFNITENDISARPLVHEPGPSITKWRIVDTEPLNYNFDDDDNVSLRTYTSFNDITQTTKSFPGTLRQQLYGLEEKTSPHNSFAKKKDRKYVSLESNENLKTKI